MELQATTEENVRIVSFSKYYEKEFGAESVKEGVPYIPEHGAVPLVCAVHSVFSVKWYPQLEQFGVDFAKEQEDELEEEEGDSSVTNISFSECFEEFAKSEAISFIPEHGPIPMVPSFHRMFETHRNKITRQGSQS